MIIEQIEKILEACKTAYGYDFSRKDNTSKSVLARAAFYTIVKEKYGNLVSLEKIGWVCGRRKHCSVVHALNRTNINKIGVYLNDEKYVEIYLLFWETVHGITDLLDSYQLRELSILERTEVQLLNDHIYYLKNKLVYLETKKLSNYVNEIDNLPEDLKQEFKKFKWLPYKKMLESRKHYDFEIKHKPVY